MGIQVPLLVIDQRGVSVGNRYMENKKNSTHTQ